MNDLQPWSAGKRAIVLASVVLTFDLVLALILGALIGVLSR